MSIVNLLAIAAFLGALPLFWLAYRFATNPVIAMDDVTHHLEHLPAVMAGRYAVLGLFAIGAAFTMNAWIIAYIYAGFAAMGFYDGSVYARANLNTTKHVRAGVLSAVVAGIALVLALTTG